MFCHVFGDLNGFSGVSGLSHEPRGRKEWTLDVGEGFDGGQVVGARKGPWSGGVKWCIGADYQSGRLLSTNGPSANMEIHKTRGLKRVEKRSQLSWARERPDGGGAEATRGGRRGRGGRARRWDGKAGDSFA